MWHTCNPGIFRILPCIHPDAYQETCHIYENRSTLCNSGSSYLWHNDNPGIFRTLIYFTLDRYSEPSQWFRMARFAKVVKSYNYISKALYLRSLTEFWIWPSLKKYSLTWRVTLHYVLYETYSEPCLFLYIQIYSGIFWHI